MKNTLKRLFLLTLVCVLTLGTCTAALAEAETKPEVDYTLYPEDFASWTIADLKGYLKAAGVFVDDTWVFDMTGGDLEFMKADAGTMYIDMTAATAFDMIFLFNPANNPNAEAMLASIIENQALVVDGDVENGIAIDAVLGNFCFAYLTGVDDAHINSMIQAIRDLGEHFAVEAAYINE